MNTGLPGYCNNGGNNTLTPGIVPVIQKSQKFWVRVWGSYKTYRSSGYGYGGSVAELTEVPGIVARAYRSHRSSGQVYT